MFVDSVTSRAYQLFSSTFRARAKEKLKATGRGIFTGKLIESISFELENEDDDNITINIFSEDYLDYIDKGVDGTEQNNKSTFSFKDKKPPIKALKPWADAKGINVWVVQNSIFKKGIKGLNFFDETLEDEYSKLADYIAEAQADDLLNDLYDDFD